MADVKPLKLVDQGGGAGRLAEFEAGDTLPKASLPALSAADVGAVAADDPRLSDAREWTAQTVSQDEAEAGTATTRRAWTAQRVRQAIVAWWNSVSSAWGRGFVGSANAAAGRTALGLGDAATSTVQNGADDLTVGRLVLTETVRRQLTGDFSSVFVDRLILLHPLHESSLLPYSIVDGKITATRGGTDAILLQESVEIVSSSAYSNHISKITSDNPDWRVVSCRYNGVRYAALIIPYMPAAYGGGIFFEGRAVSTDANQLLCVSYYNRQTSTALNAEVYNSIAPLDVLRELYVGGDMLFRRGNILGTVSQSGGVPTGAIIERGSNANGSFVKFADGTLICLHKVLFTIPSATLVDVRWTYPATFAVHPNVYGTLEASPPGGTAAVAYAQSVTVNFAEFTISRFDGATFGQVGTTRNIGVMAIGRWY